MLLLLLMLMLRSRITLTKGALEMLLERVGGLSGKGCATVGLAVRLRVHERPVRGGPLHPDLRHITSFLTVFVVDVGRVGAIVSVSRVCAIPIGAAWFGRLRRRAQLIRVIVAHRCTAASAPRHQRVPIA